MILNINLAGKELVVTADPRPKVDQNGVQRLHKETEQPVWTTEVVVTDDSGGEIIKITTAGERPDVQRGDEIEVSDLVACPWSNSGRSGIAYRADFIKAID